MKEVLPSVGAFLALLVTLGGAATAQDHAPTRIPTLTVQGVARREVAPDMAVVTLGVTRDRASALDASAETARTAQTLIGTLKASGVAEGDIATAQATVSPVYDSSPTPKIKAFRAANVIQVRLRKLDQAGDLAGRLLDKGANELQGVDFVVADPEPVLDGLRTDATRDARRRAEIYAGAAGVRLGRILEIQPETEGVPQSFARHLKMDATAAAAPVSVPLEAGAQSLEARVTIVWEIEQPTP